MFGHVPWDFRVTLDLFLGGLGIGIFLISAILSYYDESKRYASLVKTGAYLAPVLVGLGVLMLLSELGRPERFLTTMFRVNPGSLTSWGGFFQAIFMALSLVYAGMLFKGKASGSWFAAIKWLGAVFALAVGVYHGLLLASLGRPLWAGGMVSALFLTSSLFGATALLLLVQNFSVAFGISPEARSQTAATAAVKATGLTFTLLFFGLAAINLVLIIIWHVSVYRSSLETVEAMNNLLAGYGLLWWIVFIVAGLLIPLLGSLYYLIKKPKAAMSGGVTVLLALLAITGSFVFKHLILTAGQIPVYFF